MTTNEYPTPLTHNPEFSIYCYVFLDQGNEVVGVSLDVKDRRSVWLKVVERIDMPWVQVSNLDPEGTNSELAKAYGVSDVPYVVIINKEGIIVDCVRMPAMYLERALQRLP